MKGRPIGKRLMTDEERLLAAAEKLAAEEQSKRVSPTVDEEMQYESFFDQNRYSFHIDERMAFNLTRPSAFTNPGGLGNG